AAAASAAGRYGGRVLADEVAMPPGAGRPPLRGGGEAVQPQACPNDSRWRVREGVPREERQDRGIALEELRQERHEPFVVAGRRERGEPHEPVEPQVGGGVLRRPPSHVSGLGLERV